jgi:hypothetical protein
MKLYSSNLKRDSYKEKIIGGRFGHNEDSDWKITHEYVTVYAYTVTQA